MTIPETLEEATSPAWLSEILGAEVVNVEVGEVDNRVSTNAPVRVTLAGGGERAIWIKGYFTEIGQFARTAGVPEALFYRDLRGRLSVRTLRAVFAEADPETLANVVVTEDVMGQGAEFLHALSPYSVDQAAESLEQLAALHAETWMDESCASAPWLASRVQDYTVVRGMPEITENFEGPIGAGVPAEVRDGQRLFDAFVAVSQATASADPWCVIHGDTHIGNIYLDGSGRPSLVDWQLVQRGPWFIDVGYHLATALSIEDRRRTEEDLVRHYLERLGAGGVELAYDGDVWRGLRRGMVHGFYLWAITLKVRAERTAVMLERLGTAVADHDAYEEAEP